MIHWIYNTLHEGGYSLKLILEYLKRYKLWFVLNVISVFGFALVELGIPTIIAYMIDQGVMNEDRGFLMKMGALTAVISLVGVCGTILLGYCCARISTGVAHDIRQDVLIMMNMNPDGLMRKM